MEWTRTSVPLSEAVASRRPSWLSAMHASALVCAWMNLVRRTSYSSTRTCPRPWVFLGDIGIHRYTSSKAGALLLGHSRKAMPSCVFHALLAFLSHKLPCVHPDNNFADCSMGIQETVAEHVALRMQHVALVHVPSRFSGSAQVVLAWAML